MKTAAAQESSRYGFSKLGAILNPNDREPLNFDEKEKRARKGGGNSIAVHVSHRILFFQFLHRSSKRKKDLH